MTAYDSVRIGLITDWERLQHRCGNHPDDWQAVARSWGEVVKFAA